MRLALVGALLVVCGCSRTFWGGVALGLQNQAAYSSQPSRAVYHCQIDDGRLWFDGRTRVEGGKLLYLYRCPQGHFYWIVR
jgi:hypothetical protein